MKYMDDLEKQRFIFGSFFLLPNKLQVIVDKKLERHDITAKQWFLTAILERFGDYSPTLKEVAKEMGSSHQNVKQLALKLQSKGFLKIVKDEKDKRSIRLELTEKSISFWNELQDEGNDLLKLIFSDMDKEEIDIFYNGMNKLINRILDIEDSINN